VGKSDRLNKTEDVGLVTWKKTTFDVPPPGVGFTTLTATVPAVARSEVRIVAFNCPPLT
jgi:hypothetical protein